MQNNDRGELIRAAATAFSRANALFEPMRLHAWDEQGLTVTQLRLLCHLAHRDGMGNAELAELLYITRPSVSALLERLERGGFIRREIDKADRRGIRICLEPRGRQALETFQDETREFRDYMYEGLSDDQLDALTEVLDAMVAAAEASREAPVR